jgi:hypothetical protein
MDGCSLLFRGVTSPPESSIGNARCNAVTDRTGIISRTLFHIRPLQPNDSKIIRKEVKVNVERKDAVEGLTSLAIQVDEKGQVHSFTDENATWKFVDPITVVDLVDRYNDLLTETTEGLASLVIQVDEEGKVHSFTDSNATWKFVTPITVVELVDKYKMLLANVVVEPKVVTNKVCTKTSLPPQTSSDRFFLRR